MPPRRTATATRTALTAPAPTRTRIIMQRAAPIARRATTAAARAAFSERHTLTALASAAALGYADREDMLTQFSLIDGVDPKVQLFLAVWLAGKFTKSNMVQHAATGIGSVALYDAVRSRG